MGAIELGTEESEHSADDKTSQLGGSANKLESLEDAFITKPQIPTSATTTTTLTTTLTITMAPIKPPRLNLANRGYSLDHEHPTPDSIETQMRASMLKLTGNTLDHSSSRLSTINEAEEYDADDQMNLAEFNECLAQPHGNAVFQYDYQLKVPGQMDVRDLIHHVEQNIETNRYNKTWSEELSKKDQVVRWTSLKVLTSPAKIKWKDTVRRSLHVVVEDIKHVIEVKRRHLDEDKNTVENIVRYQLEVWQGPPVELEEIKQHINECIKRRTAQLVLFTRHSLINLQLLDSLPRPSESDNWSDELDYNIYTEAKAMARVHETYLVRVAKVERH